MTDGHTGQFRGLGRPQRGMGGLRAELSGAWNPGARLRGWWRPCSVVGRRKRDLLPVQSGNQAGADAEREPMRYFVVANWFEEMRARLGEGN